MTDIEFMTREQCNAEITRLKRDEPNGWRGRVLSLMNRIRETDSLPTHDHLASRVNAVTFKGKTKPWNDRDVDGDNPHPHSGYQVKHGQLGGFEGVQKKNGRPMNDELCTEFDWTAIEPDSDDLEQRDRETL